MLNTKSVLKQHIADIVDTILQWSTESSKLLNKSELINWLCTSPRYTTFRVNTLTTNVDDMLVIIKNYMEQRSAASKVKTPEIKVHPLIPDCIVISAWDVAELDLLPKNNEVIVDAVCGTSVLRGSNIYAKGVMGMLPGTNIGDEVSVYADLTRLCKKGRKLGFFGDRVFIGNGIVHMNRRQLFTGDKNISGLAIEMTNPVNGIAMFPVPDGTGVLQNVPSILCSHLLEPKSGMMILDVCAAPGNKTTHIAALMDNQGLILAIDRNKNKIPIMKTDCISKSINCVRCFAYDSTKLLDRNEIPLNQSISDGPPFKPHSFDRILLDSTCSGFGQRPLLYTLIESTRRLSSYPVVQRQLFHEAIPLLKPGGILVYSTCSVLCEENEHNVRWVLESFCDMELIPTSPVLGGPGLPDCGLNDEQRSFVQRFGPNTEEDSIGFFIAKFRKKL